MDFAAIYHKIGDNFCYPLDGNRLVINLRTGKDVDRVVLYYGDPFTSGIMGGNFVWKGNSLEMPEKLELEHNFIWSATVVPEFKRCRYYFEIFSGTESVFYIEEGFKTLEEMNSYSGNRHDFFFPWMNPSDIIAPPSWVEDTVWYQIFPERFCNGNPQISPKNAKPWKESHESVGYMDFYGGDIQGIIDKLDYLKDLGITGLYLTPLNQSPSNHKYDTSDYYKIDSSFGDEETVKRFVAEAHTRGIRVMFDGVFNHCGILFDKWLEVTEKGPQSPYYDWFMINRWPFITDRKSFHSNSKEGRYYSFGFFDQMPKLNTNHPDVIRYFLDVCTYWVETFDIDAIRLDVANEISHTFCKALRRKMDSLKSDFFILGEIWHDSMPWLRGDEFDSVMNYPFAESFDSFWLNENTSKQVFEHALNNCFSMYPKQINRVLFNLLDSHDTIRLVTKLKSIDRFYQQMTVLFTMPGTVCIYYGTEVALEGEHDPDCRRCMPWKEMERGDFDDRIQKMKSLITLRKSTEAFRSDRYAFTDFSENPRVISYTKTGGGETVEIVLNCSDSDLTLSVPESDILFSHLYETENRRLKSDGSVIIRRH